MSTVNKYNYEAVLLDFAEGRLSAKETSDLFDFLAAHPELQEDFDAALEMTSVQEDLAESFSRKSSLLKDEPQNDLQNLIIASVEGLASMEELTQLEDLQSAQPEVKREVEIFSKLKFEADQALGFSRKETLLQPVVVRFSTWIYRASFAAAASILLFLIFNTGVEDYTLEAKNRLDQLKYKKEQTLPTIPEQPAHAQNVEDSVPVKKNSSQSAGPRPKRITQQQNIDIPGDQMAAMNTAQANKEEVLPMRTIEATALAYSTRTALASFEDKTPEPKGEVVPDKNPGLIDLIAKESPLINTAYGFAGNVNDKMKGFADDFRQYNEIELKIFGMRTTIRKPSWMNWRRSLVKSE